jgi:hypothetical protein
MSVPRYKSDPAKPKKLPSNLFQKGQPRAEGAGRKKGQQNATTKLLKTAISGSAEKLGMLEPIYRTRKVKNRYGRMVTENTDEVIGWQPSGKGGTEGFLVWLGCHYPRSYAVLLGRLLPLQVNAKVDGNVTVTERFEGTDIKSLTLGEKMAMMKEIIGLTKPLALPNPNDDDGVVDGEYEELSEAAE